MQEIWVQSLYQEDPWRRKWQPTPVFLPGKSHGHRSLTSYSPWGHRRVGLDFTTKQLYGTLCICLPWGILHNLLFKNQGRVIAVKRRYIDTVLFKEVRGLLSPGYIGQRPSFIYAFIPVFIREYILQHLLLIGVAISLTTYSYRDFFLK